MALALTTLMLKLPMSSGILVSNSPTVSSSDTADMTIALILAVMRRFKEGSNVMESGDWQGWAPSAFLGTRVCRKNNRYLRHGPYWNCIGRESKGVWLECIVITIEKKSTLIQKLGSTQSTLKDFHADAIQRLIFLPHVVL